MHAEPTTPENKKWGEIRLGGFEASFPRPRLPFRLGADTSLSSRLSVYPRLSLDIPISQQTVAIAAGSLSAVIPMDVTTVRNWSSRFAAIFREYAIVGARLEVRCQNVSPAAGLVAAYIEEQSAVAPTANEAADRPRLDMVAGPLTVPRAYRINWKPQDLLDLDFIPVGTTFTPAWLKLFTNTADFGTTAGTTGQVIVTGSLAMEFRGYL